jgi:hypothetical protein
MGRTKQLAKVSDEKTPIKKIAGKVSKKKKTVLKDVVTNVPPSTEGKSKKKRTVRVEKLPYKSYIKRACKVQHGMAAECKELMNGCVDNLVTSLCQHILDASPSQTVQPEHALRGIISFVAARSGRFEELTPVIRDAVQEAWKLCDELKAESK